MERERSIGIRRRFDNRRFFQAYRTTFAENFERTFHRTADGRHLPVAGETLYDLLFDEDTRADWQAVREVLCHLVRQTPEAESILSHTWLTMLKDLTGYLTQEDKVVLDDTERLAHLIVLYSHQLYDAFFEISREVCIVPPDLDRSDAAYRQQLRHFEMYHRTEAPPLKVHTYYRGIPVDSDAELIAVDEDSITVQVHRYQVVALKQLGFALIDSPLHGQVFQAYTGSVDIPRRRVTFTYLFPHDSPIERRRSIRVEPRRPIEATIGCSEGTISGRVVDLSIHSVAVYVRSAAPICARVGERVRLSVELPLDERGRHVSIDAEGQVMRVFHRELGDRRAHRIVITFRIDVQLESELLQYVNTRQSEILTELREYGERLR